MTDVKNTSPLTPEQQIRLESISLAYRHDRPAEEIVKRASELAGYIEGPQAAVQSEAPAKAGKRSKTANVEQVAPESDLI